MVIRSAILGWADGWRRDLVRITSWAERPSPRCLSKGPWEVFTLNGPVVIDDMQRMACVLIILDLLCYSPILTCKKGFGPNSRSRIKSLSPLR